MDTIFSCWSLCSSYRITHTSRIRDILLLLLLVLTYTRLAHWPLQAGSMWYTIVDDNVEAAPIYRCDGKAEQPIVRPCKIMSCIWKGNLHGWRVNRSNRCSQKQFLHLDHWIPPKSRECDKHIWSVVILRFGPVATSLISLIDLLWRTIATSHITRCTTDNHLNTITLSPLKMHGHMAHVNRSMDMCHLLLIGSIIYHLDTFMLLLSTLNINLRTDVHSIIPWFNLPQEDSSLWVLLIIGCLLENIPYGMQQLQHYNFGWHTSILKPSVMPFNECMQLSSVAPLLSN